MAQFPPPRRSRNPITRVAHLRQVLVQVFLPLVIGALVLLTLAAGAAFGSSIEASRFADVSLVWLSLFYLVFALVFLVILLAVIFGVGWLLSKLPIYTRQIQDVFVLIRVQVGRVGDKIVEPFLKVNSFTAGLKAFRRK